MKKVALIVVIFSLLAGILFWQFYQKSFQTEEPKKGEVNLVYWGIEDEDSMRPAVNAFKSAHPRIGITYIKQSLLNYRTRLATQLEMGQGVDVFEIHSSLVPFFKDDLASVPSSLMNKNEFKQTFFPQAYETLISGEKIYAFPKETNGLALFYNEEILKGVGVEVPANWQQFIDAAKKVTVKNQNGQIQTAGASLGTTTNVDFWPEILGMLFFQQPEGNLENPSNEDGVEVLQFYTSFITDPRGKTWDVTLSSSSEMFAQGKLAFYFAPVSQVEVIKQKNPSLPFKVAPVPQLSGKFVSYGSFWVIGVSNKSAQQQEAWEFIKFLYSTKNQSLGPISARVDLASELAHDQYLGAFVTQAPYYKTWYLNSNTQDAGINEEMVNLYKNAVDEILRGQNPSSVLQTTESQVKQTLEKYKVI